MEHQNLSAVLEANLSRQLHWIASADSKAAFAFTLNTAMLGVLAAVAPRSAANWTIAPAVFASFSAAFGLVSLLFLSFASFPRTDGPKGSLIYCGGVAQCSTEQFRKAVLGLTPEVYLEDLASQCHRNAEIATKKFAWVQRALLCLSVAVPFWVLALWLLYSSVNP